MSLKPILPLRKGEALSSYLARVASFHGNQGVYQFLSFIELSRQDVMFPTESTIQRVANLTGLPTHHIRDAAILRTGSRLRSFRGETFHADFANFKQTSYCPACLLEDGSRCSGTGGKRVARVLWQIEAVRTCRQHGIGLVRRKNKSYSEKFQNMDEVAPDDDELAKMVAASSSKSLSPLQDYVEDRLAGLPGPQWLDSQPIDCAVRSCERLGLLLAEGVHVNIAQLSGAQWDRAGALGFSFASRGEEGIREVLQTVLEHFVKQNLLGGPQKAFGRFYQWLQFRKAERPIGPIGDVAREFILDNFPVEAGTELFGEVVKCQRKHSVASLARKTGQHQKTIQRALTLTGILEQETGSQGACAVFEAAPAEALIKRIQTSIPTSMLPEYLNCNRLQAEQLVRNGVIPRLLQGHRLRSGVLTNVAKEDVDAFLIRFQGRARVAEAASNELVDVIEAAESSRWPVVDIVNGVLGGHFSSVDIVDPTLKFRAVLVHPLEVRAVLSKQASGGRISIEEASARLGMKTFAVSALTKILNENGEPLLPQTYVSNSKGKKVRVFDPGQVADFSKRYVSLAEHCRMVRLVPKIAKGRMDGHGILPIAPRQALNGFYYRRDQLAGLRLNGD